jgi:transcriptional regulator with XRE-family HTH domain
MTSDVGSALRLARESAGLSLAAMAARTHYSRGHLANVEVGKRSARPDVVLAYERALGSGVDRRTLLTGLGAATVAPMILSEVLNGALTDALGPPADVEEWHARVDSYGRDYMTAGASELSARLVADLVRLQPTVDDATLWAPAARLMTIYGKTLPANDGTAGAVRWYRMAADVADRSGDLDTRVWVRGRASLALAYEATGLVTAEDLATQALSLSDAPSLGRLNALAARAHVAGARSDRPGAVSWMEQAERLFDIVGSSDQSSDFAVPEWRMNTFTSMLWSRLGDHKRAIVAQDAADGSRPSTLPRFATHIELHRALMIARSGDHDGGLAQARNALAHLPPERHSLSLRLLMAEIESHG